MSSESSVKLIEDWRERWEPEFNLCGILFKVVAVFDNGEGKTFIAYKRLDGVIDTIDGSIYLIPKPQPKKLRPWRREEVPVGSVVRDVKFRNLYLITGVDRELIYLNGNPNPLSYVFNFFVLHRTTESGEWLPVEQCPRCGVEE